MSLTTKITDWMKKFAIFGLKITYMALQKQTLKTNNKHKMHGYNVKITWADRWQMIGTYGEIESKDRKVFQSVDRGLISMFALTTCQRSAHIILTL